MKKGDLPPLEQATQLPTSAEEAASWQQANRSWWQSHPMRYDWSARIPHVEFSREFFDEIDRRFFGEVRHFLPWKKTPFDAVIPFETLRSQRVLEIGVGNGSIAALLATHAQEFVGIDLTDYAVKSTTERLRHLNARNSKVLQMDAESMQFPDASFDFIWSWGVIHHSADTERVLREMARVLKPGGRAVVMVYHRSVWHYNVTNGFINGILRGDLFRTRSLAKTMMRHTDGALARFYRTEEWRALSGRHFDVGQVFVLGPKAELVLLPSGGLKNLAKRLIPDVVSRFFLNSLGWGSFLVSNLEKKAE